MSDALVIVDFQNDFTPGGALPVSEGDRIAGPINSLLKAEEIDFIVKNSESRLVLVHSSFRSTIEQLELPEILDFDDVQAAAGSFPADYRPISLTDDDDAIIIYTSGTTGRPKGCILTHGNLIANARQITEWLGFTEKDRLLLIGATDLGVWCNKRGYDPPVTLSLSRIPGMTALEERDGVLEVGGAVTLAALEGFFRDRVPAFAAILSRFGSPQIRNAGTLAGNVANASPIADTLPFLFVMEASVELAWPRGRRAGV